MIIDPLSPELMASVVTERPGSLCTYGTGSSLGSENETTASGDDPTASNRRSQHASAGKNLEKVR
jgi:hypothetical protein